MARKTFLLRGRNLEQNHTGWVERERERRGWGSRETHKLTQIMQRSIDNTAGVIIGERERDAWCFIGYPRVGLWKHN